MKKYLLTIFGMLLIVNVAYAAPIQVNQGGTGALTFSVGQCLVGNGTGPILTSSCGSTFSFTPQSWGNSTTTRLGFLNGFLSTASSTQNGPFRLTTAANGVLASGVDGLVYSTATGTVTCTGTVSCGAGSFVLGSNLTITGSGGGSSDFPFTPVAGGNSTTTLLYLYGGVQATGSSTIQFASTTNITSSGYAAFATAGGRVGVGTANPTQTLDVNGNALIGGGSLIVGASTGVVYFGTPSNNYIYNDGTTFNWRAGGTDRFTITNATGNIGINETNPQRALHVKATTPMRLERSGENYLDFGFTGGAVTGDGLDLVLTPGTVTSFGYLFQTYNGGLVNALAINKAGNLGIGTTSPNGKFVVNGTSGQLGTVIGDAGFGTAYAGLSMQGSLTSTNYSLLGDVYNLYINRPAGGDIMFREANNPGNMIIKTGGNVGIGTTSPWAQLSVNPNGISGPSFVVGSSTKTDFIVKNNGYVGIGTGDPTQGQLHIEGNSDAGTTPNRPRIAIKNNAGSGSQWSIQTWDTSGDGNLSFQRNSGSGNFTIPTGNMGVGTTSPAALLSVAGNQYLTGNLGVGISSPSARLHVNLTDTTAGLYIGSSTTSFINRGVITTHVDRPEQLALVRTGYATFGVNIDKISSVNTAHLVEQDNSRILMSFPLNNTGYVGIGDTSPDFGLDVSIADGSGWAGKFASSDSVSGVLLGTRSGEGSVQGITSGGSADVLALNPDGGNVGIGTTSPTALLSIGSNGGFYVNSANNWVGIGTSSPMAELSINDPAGNSAIVLAGGAVNNEEYELAQGIQGVSNGGFSIRDLTNATDRFVIAYSTGNVGIGTTTPSTKLAIGAGNVYLDYNQGYYIGDTTLNFLNRAASGAEQMRLGDAGSIHILLDTDNNATDSAFTVSNNATTFAGSSEIFRVQENGNMGIGSSSPMTKLVVDDATVSANNKIITVGSSHASQLTKGVIGFTSSVFSLQALNMAESVNQNMALQPAGGNLGVGSTSPVSALSIHGSDRIITLRGASGSGNSLIRFADTVGYKYSIGYNRPTTDSFIIYDDQNTAYRMHISNGGGVSFGSYAGANDAPASGLIVSGNVGIATSSPGSLLSVGNTGGINFQLATSTFRTTGGIDISDGCFSIDGVCVGGGAAAGGAAIGQTIDFIGSTTTDSGGTQWVATTTDMTSGGRAVVTFSCGRANYGTGAIIRLIAWNPTNGTSTLARHRMDPNINNAQGVTMVGIFYATSTETTRYAVTADDFSTTADSQCGFHTAIHIVRSIPSSSGVATGNGLVNTGNAGQAAFYATTGNGVSGSSDLGIFSNKIGIGTTSPYAKLSVQSEASTGDAFAVATSTGKAVFGIDNDGHKWTSGPKPTLSACGTDPSLVGSDQGGAITVGSGVVLSCTITFSKAYRNLPYAHMTINTSGVTGGITSISTTAITFSFSATVGGGIIYYDVKYHQ